MGNVTPRDLILGALLVKLRSEDDVIPAGAMPIFDSDRCSWLGCEMCDPDESRLEAMWGELHVGDEW